MLDTYTTIQGDTFDMISKKIWGDEKLMHHIMKANPGHQETILFSAGITLNIPELNETETLSLPTWRTSTGSDTN